MGLGWVPEIVLAIIQAGVGLLQVLLPEARLVLAGIVVGIGVGVAIGVAMAKAGATPKTLIAAVLISILTGVSMVTWSAYTNPTSQGARVARGPASPSNPALPASVIAPSPDASPTPTIGTKVTLTEQHLEDLVNDPKIRRGPFDVQGKRFDHGLGMSGTGGSSGWIAVGNYTDLSATIAAEQAQFTFTVEMDGGIVVWKQVVSPGQGTFVLDCDLTGHSNLRISSWPAVPLSGNNGLAVWADAQMSSRTARSSRTCDPPSSN